MQAAKQLFKLLQGENTIDKNVGTHSSPSSDTTTKGENTAKQIVANDIPRSTLSPQHTNLIAVVGKTCTYWEWKIPDFQTLHERQNATHRTMDAITNTISMMEITKHYAA